MKNLLRTYTTTYGKSNGYAILRTENPSQHHRKLLYQKKCILINFAKIFKKNLPFFKQISV